MLPPEPSQPDKSQPTERASAEPQVLVDPLLGVRVLEALGTPLLICDSSLPDNPIIYANPAFEAVTGYPPSETLGRNCRFLQGQDADPQVIREIGAALQEGRLFRGILLNHGRDGTPFWNEMDLAPIRDALGRVTHFVGVLSNISQRVGAQEALRAVTTRLEALIAGIQAGVIVEDDWAQLVLTNQAFCDLVGIGVPPQTLVGTNVVPLARNTSLLFADPDGFMERALRLRREQSPVQAEVLELADGRVWERDYVPVLRSRSSGIGGHLWLFRDVTARRRTEERLADYAVVMEANMRELEEANTALGKANARLEELARTDGLTGLINHRVFEERLAEEFRRARRYGQPLSLIVLDVDRFKDFNDAFGHLAGNELLKKLAEILREHARETDLVARFGGEEFALILPHTAREEAASLAERLRFALENTVWNEQYPITASLGVCALTPEMDGPNALVACADAAMYRAKGGGRNRVAGC